MVTTIDKIDTPYIDWLISHCHIFEYNSNYNYSTGDQVSLGSDLYESLSENNLGNYPVNSNKWHKII